MQSLNINQLVIDGLAPLAYASQHVVRHMLDMNILEESSVNDISKLSTHTFASRLFKSDVSIPFEDFSQQSLSRDDMVQTILAYSFFSNKNITMLLRSALISGTTSFRHALRDFKMTHKRIFAHEINEPDQHQYTLVWYLTIAGSYNSIEELYQIALIELNVNVKNGLYNQTILHYAVIHGNIEEIRIVLYIGVNTNLSDRFGRTALHYVALHGTRHKNDVEITKLLMDHGTVPNLEDYVQQTSLHLAIIKENYDLVEYLITLPNINVCIRDKQGYTPLCYLCENILNLSDISLENNQCKGILEQIFKIINLIIDRCPSDILSYNFHITNNGKLGENLLLHIHNKLTNFPISSDMNTLFHRLESIIIGTDQDHCLFAERLLKLHSWKSAILALCNTDNVNTSNALIECIARDPHVLLIDNISPTSDLSIVFVLIFYALATDMRLLRNLLPMCKCLIKPESKTNRTIDESCDLYISNYNLHATYITFIQTCLYYANSNVFSLKHLCRYHIRHYFKSNITEKIEKCSYLKPEHRDYLKLNELLLIYLEIDDLSLIIFLIKRLYNIHQTDKVNENLEAPIDTSSNNDTVQNLLNRSDTIEDTIPARQRTIEELGTETDISFPNLNDDQIESEHSSTVTSIKEINSSLKTNRKSLLSISDDEILTEQFENELADMKAKSKNIEEMIEKLVLLEK